MDFLSSTNLIEMAKDNYFITILISLATILLAKVIPEEKILKFLHKPLYSSGIFVSKFLVMRIGKKSAEGFEHGVLKTLISIICNIPLYFLEGMLADNDKKKRCKK